MYNPNRQSASQPRARQQPHKDSGIRHSATMRKQSTQASVPNGDRKTTKCGFEMPLYECDSFQTRYEVMQASSTSGMMVNTTDDRTVYIVGGSVYVMTQKSGEEPVTTLLARGHFINLPHGTAHEFATTATEDVEMFVVETLLYSRHVEQLTPPEVGKAKFDAAAFGVNTTPTYTPRRGQDPVAVQNQIALAQAVAQRRQTMGNNGGLGPMGHTAPDANVNVIGVNPRPSGPPREE